MPPTPPAPDPKTRLRDLAPLIEMAAAAEAALRPWLCNVRYDAVEKFPILERSTTLLGRLVSIRKTLIQIEDSLDAGGNPGGKNSAPAAAAANPDASTPQNAVAPLAATPAIDVAEVARELAETSNAIQQLAPSSSSPKSHETPATPETPETPQPAANPPANPITANHAAHAIRALPTIPLNQLESAIVKTNERATALNQKPASLSAADPGAHASAPQSTKPSTQTAATLSPNPRHRDSSTPALIPAAAATNLSPALLNNLPPRVPIPDTS